MAFQLSPGVDVKEIDLTAIIPAVSTTKAGFAGLFNWGPVEQRITVTSENNLVDRFSTPDNTNYPHWFTAANYLGYSNNLQVVRVVNQDTALNSSSNGGFLIKNDEHFEERDAAAVSASHEFIARFPGTLGDSISVSVSDRTESSLNPIIAFPSTSTGFTVGTDDAATTSTTSFGFVTTSSNLPLSIVANSDTLRFKRGDSKTITGVTNAVKLGVVDTAFSCW